VTKLLPIIFHIRAARRSELRANKPYQSAGDTKNDHQDAQDANSKTDMVQIFHWLRWLVGVTGKSLRFRVKHLKKSATADCCKDCLAGPTNERCI